MQMMCIQHDASSPRTRHLTARMHGTVFYIDNEGEAYTHARMQVTLTSYFTFIYLGGVSLRASSLFQEHHDHMHTWKLSSTTKVWRAATEQLHLSDWG